ncbi:MAG: hypothetical protein IJF61_04830 [Clostridia bacterium]|nr:hypothetical protein [Clostridia bacterium]
MNKFEIEILVSDDIVRVEVTGKIIDTAFAADLFDTLTKIGVSVDLISLAPGSHRLGLLTFSVYNRDFSKVLKAAAQWKNGTALRICVQGGYSKITLCGARLSQETGVASRCFHAISQADTEVVLATASDTTLSFLVPTDALDRTVSSLEETFGTNCQDT